MPSAEHVTNGHDQDYGRYIVATGPYMYLGEDKVNFQAPPSQQRPPPGYQLGRSMVLVRNPNWDGSTDDLRKAYLDEISVTFGGSTSDLYNKVMAGDLDDVEDATNVPAGILRQYETDPSLKRLVYVHPSDTTVYTWMNTTVPPFDDVHVRKAVNWIVNKEAQRRIFGGPTFGQIATHVAPPSMSGALPASYDPYRTPGEAGSLAKAQAEMKLSKYDPKRDGKCDVSVCNNVFYVTDAAPPYPDLSQALNSDLGKIGISLDIKSFTLPVADQAYSTPAKRVAMGNRGAWTKDYSDMSTFFPALFASIGPAGGNVNWSMVSDPHVTDLSARCQAAVSQQRATCWDDLDRYLMQNVVPWVPWLWLNAVRVYSKNVATVPPPYTQFSASTAFDQIALTPEDIQRTKSEEQG
jgi:peptide/nickel transport system substrate-binding protein